MSFSLPFPRRGALVRAALSLALALQVQVAAAQQAQFDIAPQPLAQALDQFARQAGLQLVFTPAQVQGRQAPRLQGSYALRDAIDALLQGSGLAGRIENGTLTIVVVADEPVRLEQITVTANQLGEITEGTGSYTPGSIATATRLPLTPRETPQSISVVTRQEMDDFNLTAIDEVMAHTPGVTITTYDSERSVYWARGFAINNFQYDGIPMQRNSAYSAGNTLSDMAIYDRVEVLKGATGLLTGAGEPGATINLIRKKPSRDFRGHATVGVGSWDDYRGEVDIGSALNESGSLRGRAVASYQDKHSYLDRYQRQTSVFYGIVEADLTPATLLTVGADYQDNKPRGSTWGGIPIFDSNGDFNATSRSFNPGTRWSNWEQYTRTVFSTLEHGFDSGWVVKLQLNHQINGYDAQLGSIGSGNPDPADGSGTALWTGQYVGKTVSDAADIYASGPFRLFGREHELVVGGSYAKRRWTNQGYWDGAYDGTVADFYGWNGNVPEPDWANASWQGSDREDTYERGFYTTARWNLRDDLKLITGGRLSAYRNAAQDLDESGAFVPYVGAIYDLNRSFSLYGSYTSIFMPQSAQEESGRTLDPLDGNSYEGGLKAEFLGGRLNGSLAYFKVEQDNYALATGGLTPSGGVAYRAAQGVVTKGYEASLSGALTPRWQIHAGFTHKVARQQGSKVSTEDPESQFSLYTSYKPAGRFSGLTVGGGARWQSKTWAEVSNPVRGTEEHRMSARWLVDAMARYEFSKNLSASLNINNLLDEKYYTLMSWYGTYSWGEPRSASLSATYKF